jgi:hypothetical protein
MNYINKSTHRIWVGPLIFVFAKIFNIHALPFLVECSIQSSRCGHVWMSSFRYSLHRVLGSLLIISLVCSLCWYSFLILSKLCSCVNFFGVPNSYTSNAHYGSHGLPSARPNVFAPPAIGGINLERAYSVSYRQELEANKLHKLTYLLEVHMHAETSRLVSKVLIYFPKRSTVWSHFS